MNCNNSDRTFIFKKVNEKRMQLMQITDDPPYPNIPSPVYYDPTIHCGNDTSYFNGHWAARCSNGVYYLIEPFGTPHTALRFRQITPDQDP